MSRISPASPPYPASIQARLDALMPKGVTPLWLFRVMAHHDAIKRTQPAARCGRHRATV
jgi:hypothetical protein